MLLWTLTNPRGPEKKAKNEMPRKTIHCSLCGKPIFGDNFPERMARLRRHRKRSHSKAHRRSIKKAVRTRRKRRGKRGRKRAENESLMARNSFRIGKAEKRHKRNRQGHWHEKHGYPMGHRDEIEAIGPFEDIDSLLGLAHLTTLLMATKRRAKGRNEKESRQNREEEEAGKEAARLL